MTDQPLQNRRVFSQKRRSGYVLFLVLIVLVVASASLVTLASGSHALLLDSAARQEALQRRWAIRSLERSLIKGAAEAFTVRDENLPIGSPAEMRTAPIAEQLVLGTVTVSLVLADEEAKLNLNTIYHRKGPRGVETALRKVLDPAAATCLQLLPSLPPLKQGEQAEERELDDEDEEKDKEAEENTEWTPPAISSYGQIFDYSRLGTGNLPVATSSITCWGRGRLNMQRASDESILAACSGVVTDGLARRILKRFREASVPVTGNVLRTEVTNKSDRDRLTEVIGDGSASYSLWISAAGLRGKQEKFVVLMPDFEGTARTMEFDF